MAVVPTLSVFPANGNSYGGNVISQQLNIYRHEIHERYPILFDRTARRIIVPREFSARRKTYG